MNEQELKDHLQPILDVMLGSMIAGKYLISEINFLVTYAAEDYRVYYKKIIEDERPVWRLVAFKKES